MPKSSILKNPSNTLFSVFEVRQKSKTKEHLLIRTNQNNIEYICANLIDLPDPTFTFCSGTFSKISGENADVDPFIKEIEKQAAPRRQTTTERW